MDDIDRLLSIMTGNISGDLMVQLLTIIEERMRTIVLFSIEQQGRTAMYQGVVMEIIENIIKLCASEAAIILVDMELKDREAE